MRARRPHRVRSAGRGNGRLVLLVLVLAALAAGCVTIGADTGELPQDALSPAGPVARAQDGLWNLVFPIAVVVFVFVQGAIIFIMVKFRARPTDEGLPRQIAGNTRLEIIWTIIPAVILAVIAVPTVRTIFALAAEPEDALQVRVVGKQYWWEFEYLGEEGQGVITANELHIPAGRPVQLYMESRSAVIPDPGPGENLGNTAAEGVVHSFWVPRLAGKQDVVPGHDRPLNLEADEPGRYDGQCAEFCGLSHSRMRFVVEAHTPADFEAWLENQAQPAEAELSGLAAEGEEIVGGVCMTCHAIEGHPANQDIRIGPNLTHFNTREVFAGAIFDVDDDQQLREWLLNPPAVKPGAQMPANLVSEDEVDAVIEYLRTLE